MFRLQWDSPGTRMYSIGCDRGVVYIDGEGFAFPGLIRVEENPEGGGIRPHYYDGYRYMNESAPEEFAGLIEAFYSPEEFDVCDGTAYLREGFGATQQLRKEFNFSYRTKIGNDLEGERHGYKIHLVYNAIATPTQRANRTVTSSQAPDPLTWAFSTRPVIYPGVTPSAHFVLDSTRAMPELTGWMETQLYGTDMVLPRIPSLDEILALDPAFYGESFYDENTYS